MKKIIPILFLVCISLQAFSQEESTINKKHELKLNALTTLLGIPEISYEYIINEESSAGISVLYSFEDEYVYDYAVTPYYRFFFGSKPAAGFFVEGFGMLNSGEPEYYDGSSSQSSVTDFALGLSLGGKFLTKKEVLFEIIAGVGRNLFNENSIEAVPRFGVSVGKRF